MTRESLRGLGLSEKLNGPKWEWPSTGTVLRGNAPVAADGTGGDCCEAFAVLRIRVTLRRALTAVRCATLWDGAARSRADDHSCEPLEIRRRAVAVVLKHFPVLTPVCRVRVRPKA